MRPTVHLIGRFPPPIDGQSLATERLARLMEAEFDVRTFDTALKRQSLTPSGLATQFRALRHYLRMRAVLRKSLAAAPNAPVLWGSISPGTFGHARDIVATLPCFIPGQKVIAIAHRGHFDRIFRSMAIGWSAKRLAQRVDKFVFLSEFLSSQVAPWVPAARRAVIPYTVEPCAEARDIAVKQQGRREAPPLKLLYLSNMIASKGYLDVLEAVGQARACGVRVAATFAGRWNADADRDYFLTKVQSLGLNQVVTHHGAIRDRSRINALHREADVFLLPTYYSEEAQPISIIEALSAATPVIVTRHSGIRDMVRQGMEARFVPPKSPASITDAIADLSGIDTWQEASRHARARYEHQFSEDAVRARWLALLSHYVRN